jgi:malate synthase
MGGMAAQIPIRGDDKANAAALEKVAADKLREAGDGHDGTWVAHPALVAPAKEIFDRAMPGPNQLGKLREDVSVSAADLLAVPQGAITELGLRKNVTIALMYLKAWLSGQGCVPIFHLMEDAATAEISRAQLWQWRRHKVKLSDGRVIDDALMRKFLEEEAQKLKSAGDDAHLGDAAKLFESLVMSPTLAPFLTTPAYELILAYETSDG